jgi:hypothetical protein
MAVIPVPVLKPYAPAFTGPLDVREAFDSFSEAQTYAASLGQSGSTAYAGQLVFVTTDGSRYRITTEGTLAELGGASSSSPPPPFVTTLTGDGVQTVFPVQHNLQSVYIEKHLFLEPEFPETIPLEITATQAVVDANTTSILFNVPPENGKVYKVFLRALT